MDEYSFIFCPVDGCSYRAGAVGPRDVAARNALMAHLQRKKHGLSRATAKQLACGARFGKQQALAPDDRYATDEEARAAGQLVVETHRELLERLAKRSKALAPEGEK